MILTVALSPLMRDSLCTHFVDIATGVKPPFWDRLEIRYASNEVDVSPDNTSSLKSTRSGFLSLMMNGCSSQQIWLVLERNCTRYTVTPRMRAESAGWNVILLHEGLTVTLGTILTTFAAAYWQKLCSFASWFCIGQQWVAYPQNKNS